MLINKKRSRFPGAFLFARFSMSDVYIVGILNLSRFFLKKIA